MSPISSRSVSLTKIHPSKRRGNLNRIKCIFDRETCASPFGILLKPSLAVDNQHISLSCPPTNLASGFHSFLLCNLNPDPPKYSHLMSFKREQRFLRLAPPAPHPSCAMWGRPWKPTSRKLIFCFCIIFFYYYLLPQDGEITCNRRLASPPP